MSAQEKPLPTNPEGHCPHWKVPGRLIHWTGGSAEQAFGLSVHSSTSTVQAGSDRDLAHPASQIQVYFGCKNIPYKAVHCTHFKTKHYTK